MATNDTSLGSSAQPSDQPAEKSPPAQGLSYRMARALDRLFLPFFGGAQLGSVNEPPEPPRAEWVCDVCKQPASRHRFEASPRGRMYCVPVSPPPAET